ncbi:hypothetical protein KY316_01710, partial [Candidatus Woesearchaeota archaeon]|nr:hypothetical protein [Candidatus Woesearchaeota archaeon]
SKVLGSKNKESSVGVATGVANVGNVANVAFATHATGNSLSNPLKTLLNFMISVGEPLPYQVIAERMGKSKITVRVNMNRLKNRGLVEEIVTPSGIKMFSASNKERVKKLYNVEVI